MRTFILIAFALTACIDSPDDTELTELEEAEVEAIDLEQDVPCDEPALGDATPFYGSTFNSNCYCTFCNRYCTVDGTTYKSGTCCT